MSRAVLLFIGSVYALLFVNVSGAGEFSILSPDGSYKQNSALAYSKVLKKLKDFTLPSGDAILDKWIAAVKAVNKNFNADDIKAASQVFHSGKQILSEILPSIPDKIVHAAIEDLENTLREELDKLISAGSVTLADVDRFMQYAGDTMMSTMSKTTPTAETLD